MKNNFHADTGFIERREEVRFRDCIVGEKCQKELEEIDRHEIIVSICEILGSNPANLRIAEEIFNGLKFDIARYVLHHDYCKENSIRRRLLLWLETRANPNKAEVLTQFIDKYLK